MGGANRRRRWRRRTVEWGKDVLLVLLALSALYLTARSGVFSELAAGSPGGWLGDVAAFFRGQADAAPVDVVADGRPVMAAQPVRAVVYSGGERFAVQYDVAQSDRVFDALGGLLGEGLASAGTATQISRQAWLQALQRPGVYFDFLGSIPLGALYAWLGEGDSNPNLAGAARHILVALAEGDTVALYYSNEAAGMYYACDTSIAYAGHMEDLLMGFGGNSVTFAFEFGQGSGYENLAPYVLVGASAPAPRVFQSGNPLDGADTAQLEELRQALSFRTQGGSTYPVQGGIRVREGQETLEIGDDGVLVYQAVEQGASRYQVGTAEAPADDAGLVEATRKLAAATAGAWCGAARLYLLDLDRAEDGTVTVRFGYSLDGAAVYLQGDPCAASFTIRNGWITGYTLRLRTYEDTGERTLVLRELQAAAALGALDPQEKELSLCYEDNGGDTVQAGWTAR